MQQSTSTSADPATATASTSKPSSYYDKARSSLQSAKNLVFAGGSVKGIAHVGALYALKRAGFDFRAVKGVAGTSAGVITALAVALNLFDRPPEEINTLFDLLVNTNFANFVKDGRRSLAKSRLHSVKSQSSSAKASTASSVITELELSSELGLTAGVEIRNFIETIVEGATLIPNCTFKELDEILEPEATSDPGDRQKLFKDLRVVGFNLSTGQEQVFSAGTTPDAIISDAIRISVSIPVIFSPAQYWIKNSGTEGARVLYSDPHDADAVNDLWIDGGIVKNYPIDAFGGGEPVFGFYLTTEVQKKCYELSAGSECAGAQARVQPQRRKPIKTITDVRKALLKTVTDFGGQRSAHWTQEVANGRARTLYIDNKGIDTLAFGLSSVDKNLLLRSGAESVCQLYPEYELEDLLVQIPAKTSTSTENRSGPKCVIN